MLQVPQPRLTRRLALAIGIWCVCGLPTYADWPHVRGPGFDGVSSEKNLAEDWPVSGPPLLWSRELGQGYSGFVVGGDRLFTQYQTFAGQYLLCLDPETGKTIWDYQYDWAWQPRGAYPGPYASPTWYQDKVYYASPTGLVGCVHAGSGKPVWSRNVREEFKGVGVDFGYAATPLLIDGKVVLPVGGTGASLVALDAASGATVWKAGDDRASYCPVLPITVQGRTHIVGFLQNALVIADLATGTIAHRHTLSTGYDEHSAWPIYREPHLLLTNPFRSPAELYTVTPAKSPKVKTDNKAKFTVNKRDSASLTVQRKWLSRQLCNDILSSVLYRDHIYGFDLRQSQASAHRSSRGTFRCLDWATGKVCWSSDEVGHASLIAADDKLFLLNDTGTLILARANPEKYEELARVRLFEDKLCWTPPALWNGRLFVRSPEKAICVFVGNVSKQSKTTLKAVSISGPSWKLRPEWLLAQERKFPNDAPSVDEISLWIRASLIFVLGSAGLLTGLLTGIARLILRRRLPWHAVFWGSAFVLGWLGPNLASRWYGGCLFTWPTSAYVAMHCCVRCSFWAERHPAKTKMRWLARGMYVLLIGVALAYFELCKLVGMFVGWAFLFGLLPALAFAVLAARDEFQDRPLRTLFWTGAGIATVYLAGAGLLLWKAAH